MSDTKQVLDWPSFVRTERNKAGVSQRQLAKSLGVSGGLVGQWESGVTRITLDRIIDVCALFAIKSDSLFGPGAPFEGRLIDEPEEIALLAAWRRRPEDWRQTMLGVIRGDAPPIVPKIKRAKDRKPAQANNGHGRSSQ